MFSRLFVALTMCVVVVAAGLPQSALGSTLAAEVKANTSAPDSDNSKSPDVAAGGDQVYIAATPGEYNGSGLATVWQKKDSDGGVPGGTKLGDAGGQADYRTAATAVAPNGTAYIAWIDRNRKIVYIRSKPAGGSWGPTSTIISGGTNRVNIDIAASDNAVFAVWSEGGKAKFRISTNGGANWTESADIASDAPYRRVAVATGPDGQAIAAYATNKGEVVVGAWNGQSFTSNVIARGGFLADATASIGGNGKAYVAWRNSDGGIYYSERQPDGSWPSSKIAGGQSFGSVAVTADRVGNVHIAWSSDLSSKWDLYYAYKPADGAFQGPQRVAFGVTLANASIAATLTSAAYGHVVVERFSGGTPSITYVLFESAGSALAATPQIEGGDKFSNKATVNVGLKVESGTPTEVRYHWGAAPTDADAWIKLTPDNTFPAAVPADAGVASCSTLKLYTQVRNATGTVQPDAPTTEITIDRAVQASIVAGNPNVSNLATTYTPLSINDSAIENGGASNGDPNYTRVRQFFLGINNTNDCSGLKGFTVADFNADVPTGGFANAVPLPGDPLPGPRDVTITVTDNAGNTTNLTRSIIYDPGDTDPSPTVNNTDGLPVLSSDGTVTSDGSNSVVQTLTFSNINVSDNLYDVDSDPQNGNSYWGVWIANSRTDVGPEDASLNWYPVRVQQAGPDFSLKWSLFSGLNYGAATDKIGDYYVYVRALDGAGNPSVNTLKIKATLQAGYKTPTLYLPLTAR